MKDVMKDYNKGVEMLEAGAVDLAIRKFEEVLQFSPEHTGSYIHIGLAYHIKGLVVEAIRAYRRVLELEPENDAAHFHLGNAYGKIGEYGKARDCFLQAIKIDPKNPYYHLGAASAWEKMGNQEEAVKSYKLAAELGLDPGYQESVQSRIFELGTL